MSECKKEGLTINTSFPRIRAKEFHHEGEKDRSVIILF